MRLATRRFWTTKRIVMTALGVVVLCAVVFFGYQYMFRHTLNPWSTAPQIYFSGREYRGGREVSEAEAAKLVRVGRAPWPDRDILTLPVKLPFDADPTGIVVYTWDGKYRTYGLVGGP
jgi:hypothetical protein